MTYDGPNPSRRDLLRGALGLAGVVIAGGPMAGLLWGLRRASESARTLPLDWIQWLPVQDRYMRSMSAERLLRAGNQVGKTWGALADLIMHAEGTHPHRPCATAGEYWVICASWSQSVAVQGKLRELLSPDRLHPLTAEYDDKNGYGAKNPTIRIRHESGDYSVIRVKTTGQGALMLASATIDGALFDEPPTSQRIYTEVRKRVMRRSGWVSIAMTPVNAPVGWIRELSEAGGIEDIHTRMTVEALTPIGSRSPIRLKDGTLCDQVWIDAEIAKTPAHEVPVVIHGEWEMRVSGRYFDLFVSDPNVPGAHVHSRLPAGTVKVCLGIDQGSRPGKQIAHLVLVTVPTAGPSKGHPCVYVLDSYVDEFGGALPEDDAAGILAMLARHGMTWASIDYAWGDRVHMPGTGRQKSNLDLQAQVALQLRVPAPSLRPQIRTVKRGHGHGGRSTTRAGSLAIGCRWLYHAMVREGGFGVHPRCSRLIEALDKWNMADDDYKDPIDALRYGLDSYVFGGRQPGGAVVVRIG